MSIIEVGDDATLHQRGEKVVYRLSSQLKF